MMRGVGAKCDERRRGEACREEEGRIVMRRGSDVYGSLSTKPVLVPSKMRCMAVTRPKKITNQKWRKSGHLQSWRGESENS